MIELVVLAALAFTGFVVFGALSFAASMVGWIVFLPFKLLGLLLRGAAFLLALPFVILFGILAAMIGGFGLVIFCLPLIPFALIVQIAADAAEARTILAKLRPLQPHEPAPPPLNWASVRTPAK